MPAILAVALLGLTPAQDLASFRLPYDQFVLFDADADLGTTDDQVRISGQLGLDIEAGACSNLDPNAACGHLLELTSGIVGVASLRIDANASASLDELLITDPGLPPTPLFATSTPVGEIAVAMRFLGALRVEGSIEAGASFDMGLEAPFTTEFTFDPGLDFGVQLPQPDELLTSAPQLQGAIDSAISIGGFAAIEFTTTWNGLPLPSPIFMFGPEAELAVQPLGDPWWTITGSANVYAGLGTLPAGFVAGPFLVASQPVAGIDAGGPILTAPAGDRWAKSIDFGGDEIGRFVIPRWDDESASLVGIGGQGSRLGMVELDADGEVTEAWSWSGANPVDAVLGEQGAFVAGSSSNKLWLAEWRGAGDFEFSERWSFTFNGVDMPFTPVTVAALNDGSFMVGGVSSNVGNPNMRTLVHVFADGQVDWASRYGPGHLSDSFEDMTVCADGDVVMVGRYDDGASTKGLAITKVSADGTVVWSRLVLDLPQAVLIPTAVATGSDGRLMVMGRRGGIHLPDPAWAIFTKVFDPLTGDSEENRYHGVGDTSAGALYGFSVRDQAYDLVPRGTGFLMAGQCSELVEEDAWIWSIGADQSLVDCAVYDSADYDAFHAIRTLPDGGLLAIGHSEGFGGVVNNALFAVRSGSSPVVKLAPTAGGVVTPYAMKALSEDAIWDEILPVPAALQFTSEPFVVQALTALPATTVELTD